MGATYIVHSGTIKHIDCSIKQSVALVDCFAADWFLALSTRVGLILLCNA